MTSKKPKCIIVTGRPGSGKTTLAKLLGERLWMPIISRDEIKEGYVNTFGINHDQLPPDTNGVVSNVFFKIVELYLVSKVSIVIEAAFQHKVWEPRMPRLVEIANPFIIVCSVDDRIAAQRHLQRALNEPRRECYHGDKSVSAYRETGILNPVGNFVAPKFNVPTRRVSTEGIYAPTLNEIVNQILASKSPTTTC